MSLLTNAEEFANAAFDRIPELAVMVMEKRRESACWHKVKCERRLATCAAAMRPWWRWRVRVHDSKCYANQMLREKITAACTSVLRECTEQTI